MATHPEWFRQSCTCGTPGCDWTEKRLECVFHPSLPDINWGHPGAREVIIDDAIWWLDRFDFDGLRVDAVKHVEDEAIEALGSRVAREFEQGGTDYFLLGETAMGWSGHSVADNLGQYQTIARYIGAGKLDGQFDFVLHHATVHPVWTSGESGAPHLDFWTEESLRQYPEAAIMTPFLGSHDSSRMLSVFGHDPGAFHKYPEEGLPVAPNSDAPYMSVRLALTWLLTLPGAPLLYYGDEYGEFGGADPDNRHFWRAAANRNAREQALYQAIKTLGQIRKSSPALRLGDYRSLGSTEKVLAFARATADDSALVVLNLGDTAATQRLPLGTLPTVPAFYVDRLAPNAAPLPVEAKSVDVTVAARSAMVLTPL
jgi:glycosidase